MFWFNHFNLSIILIVTTVSGNDDPYGFEIGDIDTDTIKFIEELFKEIEKKMIPLVRLSAAFYKQHPNCIDKKFAMGKDIDFDKVVNYQLEKSSNGIWEEVSPTVYWFVGLSIISILSFLVIFLCMLLLRRERKKHKNITKKNKEKI